MTSYNNLTILDIINLLANIQQLATEAELVKNTDIMEELEKQDDKFLNQILKNQEKIISLLERKE